MDSYSQSLIQDSVSLARAVDRIRLSCNGRIALDLEGDWSFHRYGVKLCLVQIFDSVECHLIDPAIPSPAPLLELLRDPTVEKVVFAPRNDILLLDQIWKTVPRNVYDLQGAAKMLGYPILSLAKLTRELLGVEMEKEAGVRLSDWCQRPLGEQQIRYAAADVLYLLDLRRILEERLEKAGKTKAVQARNRQLEKLRYREKRDPHMGLPGAAHLDRDGKRRLRRIYDLRESIARELDRPPARLLSNRDVVRLASGEVQSEEEWARLSRENVSIVPWLAEFRRALREEGDGEIPAEDPMRIQVNPESRNPP